MGPYMWYFSVHKTLFNHFNNLIVYVIFRLWTTTNVTKWFAHSEDTSFSRYVIVFFSTSDADTLQYFSRWNRAIWHTKCTEILLNYYLVDDYLVDGKPSITKNSCWITMQANGSHPENGDVGNFPFEEIQVRLKQNYNFLILRIDLCW